MDTFDADLLFAVWGIDQNITVLSDWSGLLGDLESLWKVAVEIVLSIEIEGVVNGHVERVSDTDRIDDGLFVHHWHGSWEGHIKRGDVGIWITGEGDRSR